MNFTLGKCEFKEIVVKFGSGEETTVMLKEE